MRRLRDNSQKGTVLVFFAFLLPMLVFFGGMAIDFGRAYLYKSDLQNAADAAALAGVVAASQSSKARLIEDAPANKTTPSDVAVIKNRAVSASNVTLVKDIGRAGASDANTKLFTDPQNEEDEEQQNNTYYYMVELTDEVKMVFARLFLPESLLPDDWNIKVVARSWAKAGYGNGGKSIDYQTRKALERELPSNFYDWWEKEVGGNTMDEAQQLSYTNTGIKYGTDGSRSEIFNMDGTEEDKNVRKNLFINFKQDIHYETKLTENFDVTALQNMSYEEARALFYADGKKFTNVVLPNSSSASGNWTWDNVVRELGKQIGSKNATMWKDLTEGRLTWDQISADERDIVWKALTSSITATINVTEPFPMRDVAALSSEKDFSLNTEGERNLQDPLFVRIESEEFNMKGVNNTIHDITINITADADNTAKNEQGNYVSRPMVFMYEGPVDVEGKLGEGRESNTVVVNLDADFRGIIYAPNSPVKILGNGHKFYGYIIAQKIAGSSGAWLAMPNSLQEDVGNSVQTFYSSLGLSYAEYNDFDVVKLHVYDDPKNDIVYLTSRAGITN